MNYYSISELTEIIYRCKSLQDLEIAFSIISNYRSEKPLCFEVISVLYWSKLKIFSE